MSNNNQKKLRKQKQASNKIKPVVATESIVSERIKLTEDKL
jgi:hypothetical protein